MHTLEQLDVVLAGLNRPRVPVVVTIGPGMDRAALGARPDRYPPQGADQVVNAAAGAGLAIQPDGLTPDAVTEAVGCLLGEVLARLCA